MIKKEILVSVIVPVYNVKNYVDRCLNSIMNQLYENIEIIIINDGSTDGSEIICEQKKLLDDRIQIIHQKNSGLSSARNKGIDLARGNYLVFIDSDDFIHKNYIKDLLELVLKNDCLIAQCGVQAFINENSLDRGILQGTEYVLSGKEMCNKLFDNTYLGSGVIQTKMYHKSVFDELKFPVGKMHEDDFVLYKLYWNTPNLIVTTKALYYYQSMRMDSITHQSYTLKNLDAIETKEECVAFFKDKDVELYEKAIAAYCCTCADNLQRLKCSTIPNKKDIERKFRKELKQKFSLLRRAKYIKVRRKISVFLQVYMYKFWKILIKVKYIKK